MKKDARYYENKNHEEEQFKRSKTRRFQQPLTGKFIIFLNGMNFYKEFFFENIDASRFYLWPAGGLIFYLWKKHHLFY